MNNSKIGGVRSHNWKGFLDAKVHLGKSLNNDGSVGKICESLVRLTGGGPIFFWGRWTSPGESFFIAPVVHHLFIQARLCGGFPGCSRGRSLRVKSASLLANMPNEYTFWQVSLPLQVYQKAKVWKSRRAGFTSALDARPGNAVGLVSDNPASTKSKRKKTLPGRVFSGSPAGGSLLGRALALSRNAMLASYPK